MLSWRSRAIRGKNDCAPKCHNKSYGKSEHIRQHLQIAGNSRKYRIPIDITKVYHGFGETQMYGKKFYIEMIRIQTPKLTKAWRRFNDLMEMG